MTREDLHTLVWSMPMRSLAKSFGISDVALAKHCKKANVPTPPRGWWAKKEAGQKVRVVSLPLLPIARAEPRLNLSMPPELIGTLPGAAEVVDTDAPPAFPDIALFYTAVDEAVSNIRVSVHTPSPHRLVKRLLQIEEKKAAGTNDFYTESYGSRFDAPIQQRRLRILSALLTALEQSGCDVSGGTHAGEVFDIHVRGAGFALVLGVENPQSARYSPYVRWNRGSGSKPRLRLQIGNHELDRDPQHAKPFLEWADGEQPLEAQLTNAVRRIIVFAEEKRRAWAIDGHYQQIKHRKWLEEERRKAELKAEAERVAQEKAAAAARLKTLLDEAEAIGQAVRIRAYVAEVQRQVSADSSIANAEEMEAWSSWALAEADHVDPVISRKFLATIRKS